MRAHLIDQPISSSDLVDHRGAVCEGAPPAVLESFLYWAAQAPDRAAVHADGGSVSYGLLRERVEALAARLRSAGVTAGDNVALLLHNGTEAVTAVLAVTWLGAAYVPISPKDPPAAINHVIRDAEVRVVCVSGGGAVLNDAGVGLVDVGKVRLDTNTQVEPHRSAATDVAYVSYTSGSTGRRRGVIIDHGNLAHSTAARRAVYPGASRFYWVSPLNFDSSEAGLWGTLTTGGTLVIPHETTLADRTALLLSLAETRATALLCIPALYEAILREIERNAGPPLPDLRTVILAGETLPQGVADRHFKAFGLRVELVNEYGPTECTVWATYARLAPSEPVTIGVAIPGVTIDVVDEDLARVATGDWGQIMISGRTVARGYQGELGHEGGGAFIDFGDSRAYLTGDLGRVDGEGRLEFGGREDDQVKVRGHRVALGAVEQALLDLDDVARAAVVLDDSSELRAFVETQGWPEPGDMRARLADRIPAHMVPSTIQFVDVLPVTSTGKLDKDALRGPVRPQQAPAPQASTLDAVRAAWCAVLRTDTVPDDLSFFDAGGNSILVFELQDVLTTNLDRRPEVVDLFAHPTIRGQVDLFDRVEDAASDAATARLVAARRRREMRADETASSIGDEATQGGE